MQQAVCILRPSSFSELVQATKDWHYTGTVASANVRGFSVFEDGEFIGVITFGSGASPSIGAPFGVSQRSTCELTRIALKPGHRTPVSRIIRVAAMLLKRREKRLRVCVSYADSGQGHHGGVYQAAGWVYLGKCASHAYEVRQHRMHPRTCASRFGSQSVTWLRRNVDPHARRVQLPPKHKYVWFWDDRLRKRVEHLIQPYPRRQDSRAASISVDAPDGQSGEGGSTPTAALSVPPSPCRIRGLPPRHSRHRVRRA